MPHTIVIEGFAHMSRDEWNVPATIWVADRPASFNIEGEWLHHVLADHIAIHEPFSSETKRHTPVRITVEVLGDDVPHDEAHDEAKG
jgi:hypothetical protein